MRALFEIAFAALVMVLPPVAPAIQAHSYYGADCARENTSEASQTHSANGITLEGQSGTIIALDITCQDRPALFRALLKGFQGPVGRIYRWKGAARRGAIRITWEFRNDKVLCRDFAMDHVVAEHRRLRQGTACLEADGNWHLH